MISECKDLMQDIINFGKLKEILAQSTSANVKKGSEVEAAERSKLFPKHMHINKDLVDFAFMTSSLLLEVPNISKSKRNLTKNVISRSFRMLIENSENNLFNGPPETNRDYIAYAFRSLFNSDWKGALNYLFANKRIWRLMLYKDEVMELYTTKVKEVAFRVFMFRNSQNFESFSLKELEEQFELKNIQV
jgi:translation initiation factor 3 subunit C